MNREIKFKQPIFDKDGNFMQWSYFKVGECGPGYLYENNHPKPKLQFTGLKDRNGKEIYEGDIVSMMVGTETRKPENKLAVIEYPIVSDGQTMAAFGYKLDRENYLVAMTDISDPELGFEVVGNIYENPELLT